MIFKVFSLKTLFLALKSWAEAIKILFAEPLGSGAI